MRKYFLLLLVTILTFGLAAQSISVPLPKSLRSSSSNGSNYENNFASRKIHFQTGGNFGVNFGLPTYIGFQIQPKIGVELFDYVVVGLNGTYILDWRLIDKRTFHTFAVNPFVEAYLLRKQIVVHASYEFINYPIPLDQFTVERISSHCVLVGAGYHTQITAHSSINATVLLPVYQKNSLNDARYNYYTAWYQPVVRVGYNYSF